MKRASNSILIFIICLAFLMTNQLMAQESSVIDSLKKEIRISKNDSLLIFWYDVLAREYSEINADSALFYANYAYDLVKKINHYEYHIDVLVTLSVIYRERGMYNDALNYLQEALSIARKKKLKGNYFETIYSALNLAYTEQGNYTVGIEYGFKSLHEIEKRGDTLSMALANNNLANTYFQIDQLDKAMKHYKKALAYAEQVKHMYGQCLLNGNIGSVYFKMEKFDSAKIFFDKSLLISQQINDVAGEAITNLNIGNYYQKVLDDKKAIEYFLKALKTFQEIKMFPNISDVYCNISNSYFNLKDYKKAETYGKLSLEIANQIQSYPHKQLAHFALKNVYEKLKKTDLAYYHYQEYIAARDTIFNEQNRNAQFKSELIYEYNKKAATDSVAYSKALEMKNLVIGQQQAESRKQRIVIWFVVSGLIFILIVAFIIFRALRITRKQKELIEVQKQLVDEKNYQLNQQNEEISTQRDEIEAQRDEIEAQRDLVTEQRDKIEKIYNEVTSSINYAKRIQEAVLPISEESRKILGEHFVLYKPKDIVSGDFYWTTKIDHWLIVAVADCTGHGVPGAFMSMLGISFLSEIVQKQEIHNAGEILNHLRDEIIHALQQKGNQGEQKDGMDISLLVLNTETNHAQWAGANNPLYIVKSQKPCLPDGSSKVRSEMNEPERPSDFQLVELKGDKMPIAIYPVMKGFNNHEFHVQKGDCIYLFTDGMADQFGGPKGRKYMYKQLREILLTNCEKSMMEQKNILESSFDAWKKNYFQIDDVTVIGIKI